MAIDRRNFLSGSLGLLASGLVLPRLSIGDKGPPPPANRGSTALASRFPGDPGKGRLYYGASIMASLSLPALEKRLNGILTVRRSYYDASGTTGLLGRAKEDLDVGRFPLISTKVPGTWASVASGAHDDWLLTILRGLAALSQPVMLCLHHEPEDEVGPPGMTAASWVAMQQHAISLARSSAPNTTIVPILMQWTFDPRSGRNPDDWLVPESAIFGLNVYNAWSPHYSFPWQEFGPKVSMALPYVGDKPIAIGEYGCRTDHSQPGRAATWMKDAFDFCSANNVIAMSYFDSNQHPHYGGWVLDDERKTAMRQCRHRSNVALLP